MTAGCVDEMDKTVVILVLATLVFLNVFTDQSRFYDFVKLDDGSNTFNYS